MRPLAPALALSIALGCWHDAPKSPHDASATGGASGDGGDGGGNAGTTGSAGAAGTAGAADDGGTIDAATEAGGPPPRPAGCDHPETLIEQTLLYEGFETYPLGPFENAAGSPWVRASMGWNVEISDKAVAAGTRSLFIQSFTTKTEIDYVPIALDPLPAHLKFQITFLLTSSSIYEDFPSFGLGAVGNSKFDLRQVLAFKMTNHELTLGPGQGGEPVVLFRELDYGDPGRGNVVRVDLDLCLWKATISVATPTSAFAQRATVDVTPFAAAGALWIGGGVNVSYADEIQVSASTP